MGASSNTRYQVVNSLEAYGLPLLPSSARVVTSSIVRTLNNVCARAPRTLSARARPRRPRRPRAAAQHTFPAEPLAGRARSAIHAPTCSPSSSVCARVCVCVCGGSISALPTGSGGPNTADCSETQDDDDSPFLATVNERERTSGASSGGAGAMEILESSSSTQRPHAAAAH